VYGKLDLEVNGGMKKQDMMSSLFFLAVSIGICIHAFQMNIGTLRSPAQGFVPFFAGACLGVFSIWLLLRSFRSGGKSHTKDDLAEIKLGIILPVVGVLVAYSLVLSSLGFMATTFLFFVYFFRTATRMAWWKVFLSSTAVSAGSYLFFVVWLQCQLPSGFLGD
jgi:hypothetical protein